MENSIIVQGRQYQVSDVRELGEIQPALAAHMKARGFDAYGLVSFPRGGTAMAYRAVRSGAWQIVAKVRS